MTDRASKQRVTPSRDSGDSKIGRLLIALSAYWAVRLAYNSLTGESKVGSGPSDVPTGRRQLRTFSHSYCNSIHLSLSAC